MDFKTFADAYAHNRRTLDHLVNLLRNRVDRAGSFALLLGAGASRSSGIRSGGELVEDWRRRLYAAARTTERYDVWLRTQDWHGRDEEYSYLFERLYDQPSQRRAFIEREVSSAQPSWGYAYLVSLLEAGYYNVVFTTNFDDLLNEACYLFGDSLRPLVCAHDSAVASVSMLSDRPKVLKLHGDFLFDSIKNTSSELQSLEANMKDKFAEFSRDFGLIVMGYSGSDKSVMDLLDVLVRSPHHFRHGVYWLVHRGSTPGSRLCHLLRHDRVFWVECDGFDETMAVMADGLDVGVPRGVAAPHLVGMRRVRHLLVEDSAFGLIREEQSRVSEVMERVSRAFQNSRIPVDEMKYGESSAMKLVDDLEATGMLWIRAQTANDAGDYAQAAECFQKLSEKHIDAADREVALWEAMKSLLRLEDKRSEIRERLRSLGPAGPEAHSQYFVDLSYFLLHVNDSDAALKAAERAIELNMAKATAWVNKGVALVQLGRQNEAEACAQWLCSADSEPQYQAAGYALVADFQKMLSCLERSIILRKYTLDSAMRDVVFRPYWAIPEFCAHLSHISTKPTAVPRPPYSDGLTPPEVQVRDRVLRELANSAPPAVERVRTPKVGGRATRSPRPAKAVSKRGVSGGGA